jgi:signal transduction histidine kinase
LFRLYQRFHDHAEGKGLGLFLIKSQLEALGGSIDIESELGIGTTFILKFKK